MEMCYKSQYCTVLQNVICAGKIRNFKKNTPMASFDNNEKVSTFFCNFINKYDEGETVQRHVDLNKQTYTILSSRRHCTWYKWSIPKHEAEASRPPKSDASANNPPDCLWYIEFSANHGTPFVLLAFVSLYAVSPCRWVISFFEPCFVEFACRSAASHT